MVRFRLRVRVRVRVRVTEVRKWTTPAYHQVCNDHLQADFVEIVINSKPYEYWSTFT